MKKILVPCDFSAAAIQAFKLAAIIAKKSKGEIILLHVIELPVLFDSAAILEFEQTYFADSKKEAQKKVKKMMEKWGAPGMKAELLIEYGGTVPTIKKVIADKKIDLVIIGTHGASGLKEFTIGSNAEKIVRSSPVPVIAIKNAPVPIKEIVFPTRPDLDQEELTMKVKELQTFFGAHLSLVYINTPATFQKDSNARTHLESFAKRFMLKNFSLNIFNDLSEEEGIANFTKLVNGDLIAMRTHGRHGLSHLAQPSIAEDVVNHIQCPVWTYRIE